VAFSVVLQFPPPVNKTDYLDFTGILLKGALNTQPFNNQNILVYCFLIYLFYFRGNHLNQSDEEIRGTEIASFIVT